MTAARIAPGHLESTADAAVWALLGNVMDPEIPVLSVLDLGIVRSVRVDQDGVHADVAPTYSGCPAMEVIEDSIVAELQANGYRRVHIRRVLSPPWTTDWMTAAGRAKLAAYGIAPPCADGKRDRNTAPSHVACPRCGSAAVLRVSEFGSTACKAAYRCNDCLEPFEYFKCI